ncbi:rhamnose utilization protein RhaD (predicted bifunctional aldolase and dehydrogenase) [Sphaerotilus hippei]|uniref:Rhamnose utilization protein RhaD (Predicted bifunctional aldolase and dehydrogenase) n=1 Tax=Sphaerotilus hippei TaxID=744406 RepID=A0A318HBS4_9BURK|nr:class II aldolase/adducin family protein [Sphaerotilus hippei]PXW96551.1 rhamnose utilization protein RhaD (predicted bifunctional aldolase and dehydrogenase) [Sphaerotilus hippei]
MNSPDYTPACLTLARLSARLGADPLLIQGAGGNTSIKEGRTLWVKASGLWLRDALARPMFAPVDLAEVRRRVAGGEADPVGPALQAGRAAPGLRPSIETTLHALMPHAVVLHVHAVEAIAWAVQPDAEQRLRMPLAGQRWAWVPYARPGLPLTRAVATVMARHEVDVLLLANHGLVVGGATPDEAEDRLNHVVAALRRPQRRAPAADLVALRTLAEGTGWALPTHERCHGIATDPAQLAQARAGVLYPDHVVFLGTRQHTAPQRLMHDDTALRQWLQSERQRGEHTPASLALPGRGMLVRDDLGEGAQDMLACLADVLPRLPADMIPVCLPDDEARGLADWEAEKFRRQQVR